MNIKDQFPIFAHNPKLVYLDHAATSQKPQSVITAISNFYSQYNANSHRGGYPLAENATAMVEQTRAKVGQFINASAESIFFTGSTTSAINHIALLLQHNKLINAGDNIAVSVLEHHANLLPWRQLGCKINYINWESNKFNFDNIPANIKVIAITATSNVTGRSFLSEIKQLKQLFPQAIIVVDGAQAIAHQHIDVTDLNCDFLVFSAHKLYGPTGLGVVYGKAGLLATLNPVFVGGGIVGKVDRDTVSWIDSPRRFEPGTLPMAEIYGLNATLDFINGLDRQSVQIHEHELTSYLFQQLATLPQLRVISDTINNVGIASFNIDNIHPHDIAAMLGNPDFGKLDREIAVRAGHHCAQLLHREFDLSHSCRVSLGIYNTKEDIDALITKLAEVIATLT